MNQGGAGPSMDPTRGIHTFCIFICKYCFLLVYDNLTIHTLLMNSHTHNEPAAAIGLPPIR